MRPREELEEHKLLQLFLFCKTNESFYYLWYLVEVRADSALGQVDDARVPWDGHPAHHLREGGELHVGAPTVHVLLAALHAGSRVCCSTLNIYIDIEENLNDREGRTDSTPVLLYYLN